MASVKANYGADGKTIISYRWRCCVGRDERGKQVFATKTVDPPPDLTVGKAAKQMQLEADNWEKSLREGKAPIRSQSFKAFIEKTFLPVFVNNPKHSPSTVRFYTDICKVLVEYFGNKPLEKISALDVDCFLIDLQNKTYIDKSGREKKYSITTIRHYQTALTAIFNFAERHDLIVKNIMKRVDKVKAENKGVDYLTDEEVRKFLNALENESNLMWKTLFNVLLYCGLRRGEAVALTWAGVDFKRGVISVWQNCVSNRETGNRPVIRRTKTKSSERDVPMPPKVAKMLHALKREQEQFGALLSTAFVFTCPPDFYAPMQPASVTRWLNRFERKHGLREISPHDLRHSCGTLLVQSGTDIKTVQRILGHATMDVTLNHYIGTDDSRMKTAVDRLELVIESA